MNIIKILLSKSIELTKSIASRVERGAGYILAPERKNIRTAIGVFFLVFFAGWLGRQTIQPSVIQNNKSEKLVAAKADGAIDIKLPSIDLDEEVFRFQNINLTAVPIEINVPGKLAFNIEKSKVVSARVAGRIEKVYTFDGATVKLGQPLAEYYSPDFISAQQEYILSTKTLSFFTNSGYKNLLEDAQATVDASANRLRVMGAADIDISELKKGVPPRNTMMIRAPINGLVVKRNQDPGAYMNVGDVLATIVDPNALWFLGNVYEQDIPKISKGQVLKLRSESYPGTEFQAVANYISPTIDPITHTLQIRCDVDNSKGLLRPEMFVSAKLETAKTDAYVVPESAIVKVRNSRYVILRTAKDEFRRVPVNGFEMGKKEFAITEGITETSEILVVGATLLNERFNRSED